MSPEKLIKVITKYKQTLADVMEENMVYKVTIQELNDEIQKLQDELSKVKQERGGDK